MADPFDFGEVADLLRANAGRWHFIECCGMLLVRVDIGGGRVLVAEPTIFAGRLCVGRVDDATFYDDVWCYPSFAAAIRTALTWNGQGEPLGWHRHPATGRYQHPDQVAQGSAA